MLSPVSRALGGGKRRLFGAGAAPVGGRVGLAGAKAPSRLGHSSLGTHVTTGSPSPAADVAPSPPPPAAAASASSSPMTSPAPSAAAGAGCGALGLEARSVLQRKAIRQAYLSASKPQQPPAMRSRFDATPAAAAAAAIGEGNEQHSDGGGAGSPTGSLPIGKLNLDGDGDSADAGDGSSQTRSPKSKLMQGTAAGVAPTETSSSGYKTPPRSGRRGGSGKVRGSPRASPSASQVAAVSSSGHTQCITHGLHSGHFFDGSEAELAVAAAATAQSGENQPPVGKSSSNVSRTTPKASGPLLTSPRSNIRQ